MYRFPRPFALRMPAKAFYKLDWTVGAGFIEHIAPFFRQSGDKVGIDRPYPPRRFDFTALKQIVVLLDIGHTVIIITTLTSFQPVLWTYNCSA
ncbi:MAG: hypothetical protein RSA41_06610, partial [Christensenella sp.]